MRGLIVLLTLAGAAAAQDRPGDWKGELVVGKKYAKDITFGDQVNGKQEWFPFRGIYPITVREERDGWLRVFDGHREGWAKKDEFVLSKDAPAYFTDRIRADPKDTFAWFRRGSGWLDREDYDNAIKDFTECIRLAPNSAAYFNARGVCWRSKQEWDRALEDYNEAIRLNPKSTVFFNNRGFIQRVRGALDRAIEDYGEAIRLDPKYMNAYRERGLVWLLKGDFERAFRDHDEATRLDPSGGQVAYSRAITLLVSRRPGSTEEFQRAVKLATMDREVAPYAVAAGILAARMERHDSAAKSLLDHPAGRLKGAWPEPVINYLRGELAEIELLKLAGDKDKETGARTYLGLDHLIAGRKAEARAHFVWVKDNGSRSFNEYPLAVAELTRLAMSETPK